MMIDFGTVMMLDGIILGIVRVQSYVHIIADNRKKVRMVLLLIEIIMQRRILSCNFDHNNRASKVYIVQWLVPRIVVAEI